MWVTVGEEGGNGGMVRGETVLGGRVRKRGGEEREKKTFKDFRGGTEKGDGAVRGGKGGGFTGFEDREDVGSFPDSREGSEINGEVIEGGEIGNTFGTQSFKVEDG